MHPFGQAGNTAGISIQTWRPILSSSGDRSETRRTTVKTFITRYLNGASLIGNATLLAMLALSVTLFVGHH